jgi:hypothetical protein
MRMTKPLIASVMIAGALVALNGLATTALARGQQDQRSATDTPSSGCSSYEKAPDGSWRQIPCVSAGPAAAASTRSSATRSSEASN